MSDINAFLKAHKRNTSRGAPMGHPGYVKADCPTTGMRCQRLRMVDGAYATDGTYWGRGDSDVGYMYAIFNNKNEQYSMAEGVLMFYRAKTRKEAIHKFHESFPEYTFAKKN